MKKFLALTLILALALPTFAACSKEEAPAPGADGPSQPVGAEPVYLGKYVSPGGFRRFYCGNWN